MGHLGTFGAAVREANPTAEKDSFEFFGETFTVHGVIPPMLMLQIGAAATGKIDEQEGLGAMWEAMRCSLTIPATGDQPADGKAFDRLYKLAVNHNCNIDELMRLAMALFEVQAGRPTQEPHGSSLGQSSTSPSSSTSSSASPASPADANPKLAGMVPVATVLGG
ncbi:MULTISPECIES: hypothetical protein [Catenuloplanes]|uniref:Uncharacterized protein n=1 Tax=Catenuloplanes niger TaxID=587534 RepID=A0AAE3ZNW9_9ACTN|nr:hypothetical protein [Catenuloplanes niger]MDR7323374.1 hypothetical protein [Catenuloplanes niger]